MASCVRVTRDEKVKCVGRIKRACSLDLDVALRFVKAGLEKALRRKRLAQVDLQE